MKTNKAVRFYQDWGTFRGVTLVCYGYNNYDQLLESMKKAKETEWYNALRNKKDIFDSNHFSRWEYRDRQYTLLFLKDWKPDISHYAILAHELVHAVQFCMPDFLDMDREFEAVAYQHTYLFENIAKKLNKL